MSPADPVARQAAAGGAGNAPATMAGNDPKDFDGPPERGGDWLDLMLQKALDHDDGYLAYSAASGQALPNQAQVQVQANASNAKPGAEQLETAHPATASAMTAQQEGSVVAGRQTSNSMANLSKASSASSAGGGATGIHPLATQKSTSSFDEDILNMFSNAHMQSASHDRNAYAALNMQREYLLLQQQQQLLNGAHSLSAEMPPILRMSQPMNPEQKQQQQMQVNNSMRTAENPFGQFIPAQFSSFVFDASDFAEMFDLGNTSGFFGSTQDGSGNSNSPLADLLRIQSGSGSASGSESSPASSGNYTPHNTPVPAAAALATSIQSGIIQQQQQPSLLRMSGMDGTVMPSALAAGRPSLQQAKNGVAYMLPPHDAAPLLPPQSAAGFSAEAAKIPPFDASGMFNWNLAQQIFPFSAAPVALPQQPPLQHSSNSPSDSSSSSADTNSGGTSSDKFSPMTSNTSLSNGSTSKRKVSDLEAPRAMEGAKTVPADVFAQRQQERQAQARKAAKAVIEINLKCDVCSKRIALALFHHSDTLQQVQNDHHVQVTCSECNHKRSAAGAHGQTKEVDTTPVNANGTSAEKEQPRRKTHLQDCDLCEQSLGAITILTAADAKPPSVEILCSKCDSLFAWCTQCGGGSKYRTGKWRPKKLFLPGRKTCKLRTLRLTGTPSIEVYECGIENDPLPENIIAGMKDTFETKFLFRFAKPQFIKDSLTVEKLEEIMHEWWDFIEARLREPASARPDVTTRLVSALRGPTTAAGKCKDAEDSVISYTILEWKAPEQRILLANACISLTGLASARWMVIAGKAGCYRMFSKVHELLYGGCLTFNFDELVAKNRYPQVMLRYETDIDMERVRTYIDKGWKEMSRSPLSDSSPHPQNEWQVRTEAAFAALEGCQTRGKKLVELHWVFDPYMDIPQECAVLELASPCKTIARPLHPGEQKMIVSFPDIRISY